MVTVPFLSRDQAHGLGPVQFAPRRWNGHTLSTGASSRILSLPVLSGGKGLLWHD